MTENDTNPDFASFDSSVEIRTRATYRTSLGYRHGHSEDLERYGETERYFEHEGELVFDERLGNNIVNIDAYFDPDYLSGYPTELQEGDVEVHTGYNDVEFHFDLFTNELQMAARVRASEDATYTVRVLAEWLYRAVGSDHVGKYEAMVFWRALRNEIRSVEEAGDNVPEWALCFSGRPDEFSAHRYSADKPIQTLEGAKRYVKTGDYDAVATDEELDEYEEHAEKFVEVRKDSDDIEADTDAARLFRGDNDDEE